METLAWGVDRQQSQAGLERKTRSGGYGREGGYGQWADELVKAVEILDSSVEGLGKQFLSGGEGPGSRNRSGMSELDVDGPWKRGA
jgi:hypothetical protein